MDGETPVVSRSNVDAYRVARALPEVILTCNQLVAMIDKFHAEDVAGQNYYEAVIAGIEQAAKVLSNRAETLRNGQKPKVCQTCKK